MFLGFPANRKQRSKFVIYRYNITPTIKLYLLVGLKAEISPREKKMKLTTLSKYLLRFLGAERGQPKGPIFPDAHTLRRHILQRLKEMV